MKRYTWLFFFPLIWIGCAPDEGPAAGIYIATFHIQIEDGSTIDKTAGVEIDQPTEFSIQINDKALSKKGYRIKGEMGYTTALYNTLNVMLDGRWRKKGNSYELRGDFTGSTQFSEVRGTFEMRN